MPPSSPMLVVVLTCHLVFTPYGHIDYQICSVFVWLQGQSIDIWIKHTHSNVEHPMAAFGIYVGLQFAHNCVLQTLQQHNRINWHSWGFWSPSGKMSPWFLLAM